MTAVLEEDIYAAFATGVQAVPGIVLTRIAWPNVDFSQPNDSAPWWAAQMGSIYRRAIAAGADGAIQWDGEYTLAVLTDAGKGTGAANALGNQILGAFRRGQTITSGTASVRLEVPRPMPPYRDGKWWRKVIVMPWFCHEMP